MAYHSKIMSFRRQTSTEQPRSETVYNDETLCYAVQKGCVKKKSYHFKNSTVLGYFSRLSVQIYALLCKGHGFCNISYTGFSLGIGRGQIVEVCQKFYSAKASAACATFVMPQKYKRMYFK